MLEVYLSNFPQPLQLSSQQVLDYVGWQSRLYQVSQPRFSPQESACLSLFPRIFPSEGQQERESTRRHEERCKHTLRSCGSFFPYLASNHFESSHLRRLLLALDGSLMQD